MINRFSLILLLSISIIFLLAACQSAETEEGPDDVYWEYYEACINGKYDTAEKLLDDLAKSQIDIIGVCGYTHDAINRIQIERGGTERTFSDDPTLDVRENRAVLTWIDDQGNLAIINLVKVGNEWKVSSAVWSD